MKKIFFIILASWCCYGMFSCRAFKTTTPEFNKSDLLKVISALSADSMEGREAGTKGSFLASEFIAGRMQMSGLEPYGDISSTTGLPERSVNNRSWFQQFRIVRFENEKKHTLHSASKSDEPEYTDGDYYLEGDTSANDNNTKVDTLNVRNLIGILWGKDTTRTIIIGAHYDHLGIRNGLIYHGADDNASGVSGMLALAHKWSSFREPPPYNLVFASWTSEEKGQLGSKYYTKHTGSIPGKILICFNLDMISRSSPEDTSCRQLSIGTLTAGKGLREIACAANSHLDKPFELDLWDVTGHTGSDYRYFSEAGIPVMTFFSGYNSDYHTPRDISSKTDLNKMNNILKLIDECITEFMSE